MGTTRVSFPGGLLVSRRARCWVAMAGGMLAWLLSVPTLAGDPPPAARVAKLIRVPLPLVDGADTRVTSAIKRFLSKLPAGGAEPTLVLEFAPDRSEAGRGSTFGRASDLAEYLSGPELANVKTVAYIPRTIKGHAVLVAMACKEIVMAPDADLGEAGIDEPNPSPAVRQQYSTIAKKLRTIPEAVALGMLDKDLAVYQVSIEGKLGGGTKFVFEDDLAALRKTETVVEAKKLPQPGLYSGQRVSEDKLFPVYLAKDRAALARGIGLDATALRPDPFLEHDWVARQVVIDQNINGSVYEETKRLIDDQVRGGQVNFICLRITSGGGSFADSGSLAGYLAGLDPNQVTTVAYISEKAVGDAALIALACDQIVMTPEARLGGAGNIEPQADEIDAITKKVRQTMDDKHRSWSLPAALFNPRLQVYRYSDPAHGLVDYFCPAELDEKNLKTWQRGARIASGNERFSVIGTKAEELGLAVATVQNFDDFKQHYGLQDDPAMVEGSWAHTLIHALLHQMAEPGFRLILIFIGVAGIYVELHSPGVGIGAFLSLTSFMLYFWAAHLNGTAGWLEVLLFLSGVGCILLEIFVLPGFVIFGLGGGFMVLASLILASQTFVLPHNEYQLQQLRNSVLMVGGAVAAFAVTAFAMRAYLPRSPVFSRMVLDPPSQAEREDLSFRESLVDFRHLLGASGTTTTPLAPAGKARFGEQQVDVLAAGEFIERDTAVTVIDVRGNRVLVQRA